GHLRRDCKHSSAVCFNCQKPDHKSGDCKEEKVCKECEDYHVTFNCPKLQKILAASPRAFRSVSKSLSFADITKQAPDFKVNIIDQADAGEEEEDAPMTSSRDARLAALENEVKSLSD